MVGESGIPSGSSSSSSSSSTAGGVAVAAPPRRWLVVMNTKAGTIAREKLGGVDPLDAVVEQARGLGIEVVKLPLQPADLARDLMRRLDEAAAAGEPFDAVLAAGGDGTVTSVASALIEWRNAPGKAGRPVPAFGVLPLGTFNYFARSVGIPEDWAEAVAALASARTEPHSGGFATGANGQRRLFLNVVTIGVHPAMVKERDQRLKLKPQGRWLGKWPAMLAASWQIFRSFPRWKLTLTMPGREQTVRTPGIYVCRDCAKLADFGLERKDGEGSAQGPALTILIGKTQTRLQSLWLMLRAALGILPGAEGFELVHVPEVTISTHRSHELMVAIDGETVRLRTPIRMELVADVLSVLRPARPRE